MPMATDNSDWGRPTRNFLYGPDKTKKTWWACRAAEAGYNVILVDGDDGSSIVNQLPIEARKRILIVDVVDTAATNAFARFMATFVKGSPFFWDEKDKNSITPLTKRQPHKPYIYFDITKLTMNDVVIVDSWTALCSSLLHEWAREMNVTLTEVEKEGDQFGLFNYQQRFLDHCFTKFKTFPCHMIVIGHETIYEKYEGKGKERKMVEQRTQPFSSTGPHAKKIGANFSNCLRFRKLSDIAFTIDAGGNATTMGGCRQLAPQVYKWQDISPDTIFSAVGSKPTGEPCLGAVWLAPGAEFNLSSLPAANTTAVQSKPATPQIVDAGSASKGLSLLSKLKKA